MKKTLNLVTALLVVIAFVALVTLTGCTGNTASNTNVEIDAANTDLELLRRANTCGLVGAEVLELDELLRSDVAAAGDYLTGKGC